MENAVVTRDQPDVLAHVTPMQMLNMAIAKGTSIEQLSQLMALNERWEANEARKAFVAALNAFKADAPSIAKNKDVAFGNTAYSHATLDNVSKTISDALARHGIAHRWDVHQEAARIIVACVLTHVLGHSERVQMESESDKSGSKNPIQAIASAVTYLQRYTLLAATGMATGIPDDDGAASGRKPGTLDPEQEAKFMAMIERATTPEYLQTKVWKEAADACHAIPDPDAHKRLKEAVTAKVKALKGAK